MLRALLTLLALSITAFAGSLDPLLGRPDLWSLTPETFARCPEGHDFIWTSSAHDSARAANRDIRFSGLPVVEAIARFDAGKLVQLTAQLYTRGDVGDLSREDFDKLVHTVVEVVDSATKVKFSPRGREAANAVRAEGLVWQTPAAQYLLEYSSTKEVKVRNIPFRAEFVRLTIAPPQRTASLLASASNAAQARFSGVTHVRRDAKSGDVVIPDVPMVDQGQKGYCAVACTERVMRYYGIPVDENEIAQAANTDTAGGTSTEAMFGAVRKLGARLHVGVRQVEQMDTRELLGLFKEYNRVAKKDGAPPLPETGYMIDVGAMFQAMKPDVLMETRTRNKAELTRFSRGVEDHIDRGIPVIWSVMLGMYPEKGLPQASGGHMRLIIGYNDRTQEILYSDSWGAGHELKRMPLTQAVAMTTGLTSIQPL